MTTVQMYKTGHSRPCPGMCQQRRVNVEGGGFKEDRGEIIGKLEIQREEVFQGDNEEF